MKPLFTIHAGEYLVGSHIEDRYCNWNIWLPAKDTGIDLFVTNGSKAKGVSLQVKYSKDFTLHSRTPLLQTKLAASGWWTPQEKKIKESKADFWVFVLPSFVEQFTNFIIISPAELLRRLQGIHGKSTRFNSYLWITKSGRCWEARGLNSIEHDQIAFDKFSHPLRDFSQFLNESGWREIDKKLSD